MDKKLTPRAFYDRFPSSRHSSGDIWSSVPSFGLLGDSPVTGLVLTPACDLQNQKSYAVTYVPLIPVVSYLTCPLFARSIRQELVSLTETLWPDAPWDQFEGKELQAAITTRAAEDRSAKEARRKQTERVVSLSSALTSAASWSTAENGFKHLLKSNPKQVRNSIESIIKNAYRNDVYFLPADGNSDEGPMVHHSVALLGLPISIRTDILTFADTTTISDWPSALASSEHGTWAQPWFPEQPIRRGTLRSPFRQDLLNRYLGHFGRAGAPDLTNATRQEIANAICAGTT